MLLTLIGVNFYDFFKSKVIIIMLFFFEGGSRMCTTEKACLVGQDKPLRVVFVCAYAIVQAFSLSLPLSLSLFLSLSPLSFSLSFSLSPSLFLSLSLSLCLSFLSLFSLSLSSTLPMHALFAHYHGERKQSVCQDQTSLVCSYVGTCTCDEELCVWCGVV